MPGAHCTHSLACKIKINTRVSHHRFAETLQHSLRDGFNGFLRALPGDRALLPPSLADTSPPNLTPASGCQDHTTSAVRFSFFVRRDRTIAPDAESVHHIPRPTSVTIAKRPSCGPGMTELVTLICPSGKAKYFLFEGLTRVLTIRSELPVVLNLSHINRHSGASLPIVVIPEAMLTRSPRRR